MILNPYAIVIDAYVTLVGKQPSAASYADHKAYINTNGQAAYLSALEGIFANVSNASLGTTMLTNLGLTNVFTQAQAETYLASAAGGRVKAVLDLASLLSNYSGTDAGVLAAKATYNATTAAAYSYASNAANVTDSATSTTSANTGQSFTLTTNVDAVSGSANNDTISGLLGTSGTYSVGDNLAGGDGTDTLNLIAATGTDGNGGLVTVNSVENINIRMLGTAYASAGDQVSMNAAEWTGVVSLSNASSLANTQLDVSGLADDTVVVLNGNTDINVAFNNTSTGATANAVLVNAGSAGTATTIGSASATNTANFDFDQANSGLVTDVNLEVQGSLNLARIEAGSGLANLTVTGTGNAALITDDKLTSFNASAAAGNIDITFEGASDVVAVGGAGNDTFRFGTTISNNDSVNGGDGTDVITLTMSGFNRNLNTSNVETATVTFNDNGAVQASASTVATYNVNAGSANVAATINNIADGATINLLQDNLGAITLDFASGAASTTINVGSAVSASADVGLASLAVTDVASVTINAVAGISAGATASIATATFDTDAKSILFQTDGTGSLAVGNGGNASIGGATSISFNATDAANINYDSDIAGGSTLNTVNVTTSGVTAASATLIGIGGTGINAINLVANNAGDITVGAVALGNGASAAGATATITMTQNAAEQDMVVGAISTTGGMALTINLPTIQSSGSVDMTDITISEGSATGLAMGVTFNTMTVGTGASFQIDGIDLDGSASGAQVTLGAITMESGAQLDFGSASGISASAENIDISDITLVMGASATANFGNITTTGGAVGAITVTLGDGATATFGTVTASAIGTHSIVLASGASASFGNMEAMSGDNDAQGAIGAIEIGGVDGSDVSFGELNASAMGAVSVSGAATVTIGKVSATTMGEINTTELGVSGAFTIDLSGVTNAVELNLGVGANTITTGNGNDVITLTGSRTAVAGNDVISFTTAVGVDNIINFIAGAAASGGDEIELGTAMGGFALTDGDGSAIANATTVDLSAVVTATGVTLAATDNVIVIGTAFSTTAAMQTFVSTGIALASAAVATANMVVAWTDGSDTYVSLLEATGAGSAGATTFGSGGHTLTTTTLATLEGVTPGALAAANFDFI